MLVFKIVVFILFCYSHELISFNIVVTNKNRQKKFFLLTPVYLKGEKIRHRAHSEKAKKTVESGK